ncbi:MarR family transcriptional regulator [Shewanella sp. OPT22]|nr:MarR family transcriptional regulator [Shewanella sp. OPT22]
MDKYQNLGTFFSQLNGAIQKELDCRLKKYNLDSKLYYVLFYLWEEEGVTQTVLSARCAVANYSMTRMLDQLQELNLIVRQQEEDNKRAFHVFLTDSAKALENDVNKDVEAVYRSFLSNLTLDEKSNLLSLLSKLKI